MKQIKKYGFLFLFLLGSMYITNLLFIEVRKEDPIMKQIDKNQTKYEIKPVNAIIQEDIIIPGIVGQTIDKEKSYHKMKQYGTYNEAMTVLKEIKPDISIDSYYDKYIEKGNNTKRRMALIFPIQEEKELSTILPILEKKEVVGTIFIDGNIIDHSISLIKKYKDNEYELLSFQNEYNPSYLKTAESYLESITKKKTKYCYTEKENKELLDYCSKNKHHTIKPKYRFKEDLTYQIKNTLENGVIYSIIMSDDNKNEVGILIDRIKERGYQVETLDQLLTE